MRNYLISEFSSHIKIGLLEVNLDKILATGQVFRWRKCEETWFGVIKYKLWILRQDKEAIYYKTHPLSESGHSETCLKTEKSQNQELEDYFNLSYKLSDMMETWNKSDTHLSDLTSKHAGLRLIRQAPMECLLGFITSSCNNIPRISSLMRKLSELSDLSYTVSGTTFHSLPDISQYQSDNMEHKLRNLGFGYRAKYIVSAMRDVSARGGIEWLEGLRNVELSEAKKELMSLAGVGPKVAACVCLMSLDKHDSVPIDTHIHQVAVKYYNRPNKTLTPTLHKQTEEFFQEKHGPFAGWAQAYLFYSNSNKPEKENGVPAKKRKISNENVTKKGASASDNNDV